ncbi:MAG TPA: hypothetical protein PKH66_04385 [Thermomonas sp.]|jgi:hypothetical protein|uniref:hypothetical protein n=1 Tax=Thermomonas sp. TaxID=1971895 RepID=UPI002BBF462A|nr:hypothetical protein [Thermomonas sp.]HPW11707.1 hypothetical protein [Thermomonas sp.]
MPLRILLAILIAMLASACTAADADIPAAIAPVVADDTTAVAMPSPARLHGNWRLVAADDPHDAALMAFSIQADAGDTTGSGDYVLYQPFCDVIAGLPVTGDADCELIGLGATFDRVWIEGDSIVLVSRPTADGMEHRLELQRRGDSLVGHYIIRANDIRRAVIAMRPRAGTP